VPTIDLVFQVALNEVLREQERLLEKRDREESINVPVPGGEPGETEAMEIEDPRPIDQTPGLDVGRLRQDLPPKQAEVLDMMAEGYSLEQFAEMTGLPLGTVRSRYRLAKDKMRRKTKPNEAKR